MLHSMSVPIIQIISRSKYLNDFILHEFRIFHSIAYHSPSLLLWLLQYPFYFFIYTASCSTFKNPDIKKTCVRIIVVKENRNPLRISVIIFRWFDSRVMPSHHCHCHCPMYMLFIRNHFSSYACKYLLS